MVSTGQSSRGAGSARGGVCRLCGTGAAEPAADGDRAGDAKFVEFIDVEKMYGAFPRRPPAEFEHRPRASS